MSSNQNIQVGRDGQVVRLTRLQPPPSSTPPAAAAEGEGGDVNAKRVRVEGQESVAAVAVNKEEGKEAAPAPMLLTMAERAQKAVEELGAAGGWDEGTRARCVCAHVCAGRGGGRSLIFSNRR